MQDVIADPTVQDAADEITLGMVLDRQRELTDLQTAIAEMLYIARAKWIGGVLLPWGLLTAGQRHGYLQEVRTLVRTVKGEQ